MVVKSMCKPGEETVGTRSEVQPVLAVPPQECWLRTGFEGRKTSDGNGVFPAPALLFGPSGGNTQITSDRLSSAWRGNEHFMFRNA